LIVGLAIGEGDPVEVRVKKGADLRQVAAKFAQDHGLLDEEEDEQGRMEVVHEVEAALQD
jgi:hypothetical protein